LGDDLNESLSLAMRRSGTLGVRVHDSSLREAVRAVREYAAATTVSSSRDASISAVADMAAVFERIQERVGELLRTLDDEEAVK
jgi:hypothetical protein